MDSGKSRTLNIIKHFLKEANKTIPIKRAILFGSSARGGQKKWSDIDLAVISDAFEKQTPFERLVFLGKLAWDAKTPEIEALGFTSKELKSTSKLDLLGEILREGLVVYKSSKTTAISR